MLVCVGACPVIAHSLWFALFPLLGRQLAKEGFDGAGAGAATKPAGGSAGAAGERKKGEEQKGDAKGR